MKRYVLLSHDSKTMNTLYYDEMTGQICLLENKKVEKDFLSVSDDLGCSIRFSICFFSFLNVYADGFADWSICGKSSPERMEDCR